MPAVWQAVDKRIKRNEEFLATVVIDLTLFRQPFSKMF
jgi:hypothetical protein